MTTINSDLREYATNIGFNMTLTKTQVRLLVILNHFGGFVAWVQNGLYGGDYVSPFRALERRGLVMVRECKCKKPYKQVPRHGPRCTRDHVLTRAGELMIELLKEAGVYQDTIKLLSIKETA